MATRPQTPAPKGPGKAPSASSRVPEGDASGVLDGAGQDVPAEPAPGPVGSRRPTVHGAEVSELLLLLRQGEQAWFLSATSGNHEFAKARYEQKLGTEAPAYNVREGSARVGGGVDLVHIAVDATGATFSWSTGAKTFIPQDYFQVTWRP